MAYKKGGGAAAVAGYGSARRDIAATEKMWGGIESLWGSAQDVGVSIALKKGEADTAWGEYEAGYKELGGEGFERPTFGQKGFFKGPKGTVRISRPDVYSDKPPTEWGQGREIISKGGAPMEYDMEQIRKAGSFLGSDASAILSDEQRKKYLGRIAPGREITSPEVPVMKHERPTYEEVMNITSGGDSPFVDPSTQPEYGSGGKTSWDWLGKGLKKVTDYGKAVVGTAGYRLGQSTGFTGEGGGTGVTTGVSQIPENPYSYQNMLKAGTAQDPYTDKQREPYMEPKRNAYKTWGLSRNKHDSGGGETGWLNWFGQDENEYDGR